MLAKSLGFDFLIWILALAVVCGDSCRFSQTCSASFVNSDIQLEGCSYISSNVSPRSISSLNCLGNIQCKAIICNSSMCSQCTGDQINSLTFNSSSNNFVKRKFTRLKDDYDPGNFSKIEEILLPDGLSPGDLVSVRATPLKFDNFIIDFMVDYNNTNFHFRTRCANSCADYMNCTAALCASGKTLVLTSKVNARWSTSAITDNNYPFRLNEQFELHFLMLSDSILCYIDRKYYNTYITPFSQQSVYAIRYRGTVLVHEFSV